MDFLLQLDQSILLFIQEHLRYEWMTPVWIFITSLGNSGKFWIAASLIMLFFKQTRKAGIAALIALALGFLMTNVGIKNIVQRMRPYETVEGLMSLIPKPHGFSFPSGHTSASFAAAFVYYRLLPKAWGISALILAVLISASRLYVGVHYPSDVLAGLAVGALAGWVAVYLMDFFRKKRQTGIMH